MPTLPVDIPPADEASPHILASYGGLSNTEASTPTEYQTAGAVDASAQPPRNGRRTGVLAAAASLAAMALVVAGVVTGSQTAADASFMGTGNNLAEQGASAAKIAKVASGAATPTVDLSSPQGQSLSPVDKSSYTDAHWQWEKPIAWESASEAKETDAPGGQQESNEESNEGVLPPSETETTTATDYTGFHVMFILVDDMGKPHTRKTTRKTKAIDTHALRL